MIEFTHIVIYSSDRQRHAGYIEINTSLVSK